METTKWAIDPTHSEVLFKVKHLLISNVSGQFKSFNATVETEGDDLTTAKVHFTADLSSISTNNEQRDAHLKAADFFDAENHPQLIFEGEKLEKINEENYKAHGILTIKGTAKPIVLHVQFGGITQDPWGNTRTGFSISGKVNRKEYGISVEIGNMLGEEIAINAEAQFVKQAELELA